MGGAAAVQSSPMDERNKSSVVRFNEVVERIEIDEQHIDDDPEESKENSKENSTSVVRFNEVVEQIIPYTNDQRL